MGPYFLSYPGDVSTFLAFVLRGLLEFYQTAEV